MSYILMCERTFVAVCTTLRKRTSLSFVLASLMLTLSAVFRCKLQPAIYYVLSTNFDKYIEINCPCA